MKDDRLQAALTLLETNAPLLNLEFYNNALLHWVAAVALVVLTMGLLNVTKHIVADRLKRLVEKTDTDIDDFVVSLIYETRLFLMFSVGVSIGSTVLVLPASVANLIKLLPILALLLQVGIWGQLTIRFLIDRYIKSRSNEDEQLAVKTMTPPIRFVALAFLWAILIIVALDNMGMNITALLTGLGVGGVAVALAVQNILGDLFAALSIVIDKPFVLGDFIIVDDLMGTVEHIGLKTTRVRSLSGEQLVFSNSDLLKSRVRNYKRMFERRVVFQFGITYEAELSQLRQISPMLKEIIESQERTRFDRAHFAKYGESSLDFEVVYYVISPDYNLYMDIQQQINFEMFERFDEIGVRFAHPIRTLQVVDEFKVNARWPEPYKRPTELVNANS